MPGKPFQSSLIPYQEEIAALRSRRPPVSYARIADLLGQKYGLIIKRAAIGKFVKSRSGGRKVYFFRREIAAKKSVAVRPASQPGEPHSRPQVVDSVDAEPQPLKPKWEFTYSERYNLKRLPPEEAAAIRKKLEEEGH
jgi:hypothetical protein